jgi:peptidyl-prolyl cis-trans isomerase C
MIMTKPQRALVLGFAWAFLSTGMTGFAMADPATPPATPKVLATVNGKPITEQDLKLAMDDLGASLPQQLKGKARETYLLDYLIDGQLVVQKAMADKLDKTPDFTEKLGYLHDKALMDVLLSDVAKAATTDESLHKTYDEAAKAQKPETEIHARHILVATEADAQAALKRVKGGEDFAKVAKEVSKDPGSEGGDLGWFTKDRMVPEFADAAFKLEPGQISDPVKSQFGWHVIQVEEKREKSFPPFDQVKDQILRYVVQKAQSEMIVKLRDGAKIERADAEPVPGEAPPAGKSSATDPAKPAAPTDAAKPAGK